MARDLTDKPDKLEYDTINFLRSHQPTMLRWVEIVNGLWRNYEAIYKNKKCFGVAITQKLNDLVKLRQVKHEDIYYGTVKSKAPTNFRHSRFDLLSSFFEWLDKRAERKRQEREYEDADYYREKREYEYRQACRHAEMNLRDDDPEYLIKCDKIRLNKRGEYGLDA